MVLIVLHGLNGQNNEGRSLFDKRSTNRERMGEGQTPIIKDFPNNTTTSLVFLLSTTVTFGVANGPLTSINQTCGVDISSCVCFTRQCSYKIKVRWPA